MNSLLLFTPAAIFLCVALFGIACVLVTARALRRPFTADVEGQAGGAALPLHQRAWWKGGLWFGYVMSVSGLVGLWLSGLSIARLGNAPSEWSDGRAQELEPLIRSRCLPFIQRGKSVGMSVALVTPTQATVMAFGRESLSSGAQVNGDTQFEIGSITKTFTAIALARAIERGALSLDQPIKDLLPSHVALPVAAQAVTLRHLTTHTSGFPRLPGSEYTFVPGALKMLLFGSDPYAGFSEDNLLSSLQTVQLSSGPGIKSEYFNFGLIALGYVLSKKAGTDFGTLIEHEVCRPLGMTRTTVEPQGSQVARSAQGYRAVLRRGPLVLALRSSPWHGSATLGGAGALRSTGTDLLKYLQANMRPTGNSIEQAVRTTHQELFRESETTAYGMNWVRSRGKDSKRDMIWHNGGTGGFRSFLGFTEDGRVGVLVLSNTAEPVDDLAIDLLRDLIRTVSKNRDGI